MPKIDIDETVDGKMKSGDLDKTLTEEGIITSRKDLESEDGYANKGRGTITSIAKKG
jgi:hypothetical protein